MECSNLSRSDLEGPTELNPFNFRKTRNYFTRMGSSTDFATLRKVLPGCFASRVFDHGPSLAH